MDFAQPWSKPSIHMLNNDALIHIFHLFRLAVDEDDETNLRLVLNGRGNLDRERWWYSLVHVCQRWRYLILASSSYLDLCLVCTNGAPVSEMLTYLPPLPLIVDYWDSINTANRQDLNNFFLAIKHRNRVRRIRLRMFSNTMQMLISAMDVQFPILEHLFITPSGSVGTSVILPETFQAPHLSHLVLNVACRIGSPLFTTRLVTLSLYNTQFHPTNLLLRVSLVPQLETLSIMFPIPEHGAGEYIPMTPVILPNLSVFRFGGTNIYLDVLLTWIRTPLLKSLRIFFSDQFTSVPHLLQFMNTTENLKFSSADFVFRDDKVSFIAHPNREDMNRVVIFAVQCTAPFWQVESVARLFNVLSPIFLGMEHLTLNHCYRSSLRRDEVDRVQWHELFRPFCRLKRLDVDNEFVSSSLLSNNGRPTQELLPELNELTIFGGDPRDALMPFIDARRMSGYPVCLVLKPGSEFNPYWDRDGIW